MQRQLLQFIAFGCLGITTEIFFTALSAVVTHWRADLPVDGSLTGHSYIWMFPIYGSAALLLPIGYRAMRSWPLPVRMLVYGVGIFAVEFVSGWLLELVTARCPWEYDAPLAVLGYIRLDYYPFWVAFSWLLEKLYLFLEKLHYRPGPPTAK